MGCAVRPPPPARRFPGFAERLHRSATVRSRREAGVRVLCWGDGGEERARAKPAAVEQNTGPLPCPSDNVSRWATRWPDRWYVRQPPWRLHPPASPRLRNRAARRSRRLFASRAALRRSCHECAASRRSLTPTACALMTETQWPSHLAGGTGDAAAEPTEEPPPVVPAAVVGPALAVCRRTDHQHTAERGTPQNVRNWRCRRD